MRGARQVGKTTLLRLVDGTLRPATGTIRLDPSAAVVAHCPQTADTIDETIAELATAYDGDAQMWRGRLALDPPSLERWDTLSPGERKRWQVGGALLRRPDVLLLDEPTNHLDDTARRLFEDRLQVLKTGGFEALL